MRPFTPLSLEVGFPRHASLAGEMSNNATGDVLASIREAPIQLEGLKNGSAQETEINVRQEFRCRLRTIWNRFCDDPIFVEGPITVLAAAATAESVRRGELEVVDRLFVSANFVPIDRGDNVKEPARPLQMLVP